MGSGAIMIEVVRGYGKFSRYRSVIVMENYLGGDIAHYIRRFDDNYCCLWSIDNLRKKYVVWSGGDRIYYYQRGHFLEALKNYHPNDFDFFIWNPDVFEGVLSQ
jgi:hypothetical protein